MSQLRVMERCGFQRLFRMMAVIAAMGFEVMHAALPPPVAMEDEYHGYNFRKEHGLPDDDIRALLQTRDGSLWLLTQSGLARYDGASFTVYNRANTPDFQSDDPRVLVEDLHENLWIGGRKLLLRMTGGRLRPVKLPGDDRFEDVFAICADSRGNVWIGGDHSVARVRESGITMYGQESGLPAVGHITAIVELSSGRIMVGAFGGLYYFDEDRQRFKRFEPHPQVSGRPAAVLCLHTASDGRVWGMFDEVNEAGTRYSQHPSIYVVEGGEWKPPSVGTSATFTLGYGLPFMLETRARDIYLPGEPNQLHRLRQGRLQKIEVPLSRGRDVVTCMREDHEGGLWMGTLNSGLWRWQPRQMRSYSAPEELPHDNTWAVCEGLDGAVWVGTDGGLARYSSGSWDRWTTEQGLSRNNIRALAVDGAGTVWIGTGEGLNSWRSGGVSRHPILGDWFESKIRVILPTRDGGLWVAGAAGLHRLAGGQRTKFTTAEGLANNDVRALLEAPDGRLWIGTFGGGLQSYGKGGFTTYSSSNGLANEFVWALHQNQDGTLWIGTESGLYRLLDGRIASFTKAQGLPDNLVNCILEDDYDQLWISHDRGIYRVHRAALNDLAEGRAQTVHCVSYTKADGLPSEETNGQKSYPPGCKTRDGRLWFATTKGVVVIDPKLHRAQAVPPAVVIESLRATGDLVFTRNPEEMPARELSLATQDVPTRPVGSPAPPGAGSMFHLPPGSGRVLELSYTANTFVNADRARFKYRLVGLEDRWVDAGTRRQAFFTNLKPGDYQFQVIAANHQGVWNESGATCGFRIAPFFYQTWWYYSLCGAVILAAGGSLASWRWRRLRELHRLERQAAVATERCRIAQDLHDGLGADLTRLTALADTAVSAETASSRDQLRQLAQHSRAAARGLKDLIWMANPSNDTLESFLDRLCLTAEEFLRDAHIGCRFDLPASLPARAFPLEKRRNLLLVVREALHNVVKHSRATEVRIAACWQGERLELTLQDNGQGFDPRSVRAGTMGLSGMLSRVEKFGGSFEIESSPGVGTRLLIRVKLPTIDNENNSE
ncbi:MAG: hypothetical protein JNN07_04125 [Verrucomicrobiales bacterium]|nr:hypothetical protein [Verrucomicrobiales bacterium]